MDYSALESFLQENAVNGLLSYEKDYELSRASSFFIGGPADYFIRPDTVPVFCRLLTLLKRCGIRFLVIGNGSNLLFDDDGFRGAVVFTGCLRHIEFNGNTVSVETGAALSSLVRLAAKQGLGGISCLYGIPGTVGGGVYMNAGAFGGEVADHVLSVRYFDTDTCECHELSADRCGFAYRSSIFQDRPYIILSCSFSLVPGQVDDFLSEMEEYLGKRREKQPLEFPSAGSTFKRFPGVITAQLIDSAGLKGCSFGGAQVSTKHAGFIVNKGGATSNDVKRLIRKVQDEIMKQNGILIECEIQIIPAVEN